VTELDHDEVGAVGNGAGQVPLGPRRLEPRHLPDLDAAALPDSVAYRVKNKLLGPPLHTDQLAHERLGKPTALAVFASDNLSSSAYATEEILRVLVPVIGLAAFSLVLPITIAMLVVLALLIVSYRQTIKAYPSAGGAYVVTKDNFGIIPAQVAGVSLLVGYVLTVAVSVAAGSAALASAAHPLIAWRVPIALFFIALILFGNLRGVRESGKVFAVPTYFFIANMAVLLGVGLFRWGFGDLPQGESGVEGMLELGDGAGTGLLFGASLFIVLRAFASGGSAVTGVEAISNGVPAFRAPEWRNARTTLVIMGSALGVMFFGLSALAAHLHTIPFEEGSPTVIAQIGKLVYGDTALGHVGFYALQTGTVLILVLAANTSYADFPRLASFAAGDNFLPRQLTKRGHRLVFSNGMIALSAVSAVLVVATDARVERLIPLYAIGVFTSFTMSQAGMARHHVRIKEQGWRWGLFVNAVGALISFTVALILGLTQFTRGAWVVIVLVPAVVALLVRLNRQYTAEDAELERDAPKAAEAPILRRHVVLVFVGNLDLAAARAIQYARTLAPDELGAVHIAVDLARAKDLATTWRRLGLAALPLQIVDCPDRRLARRALEVVAEYLADGQTEVTILIPRRRFKGLWHRVLHDRTSDELEEVLSTLPHANVTIVPYHVGRAAPDAAVHHAAKAMVQVKAADQAATVGGGGTGPAVTRDGLAPISSVTFRQRVRVGGRVQSVRVQPWGSAPTLECTVDDGTGRLLIVFLGRRHVPGVEPGTKLVVEGVVGEHRGRIAVLNPRYELVAPPGD
jgi:amino acid transporter